MRLAASSIAWPDGEDAAAAGVLRAAGATAVELAPGKVWADPPRATAADRRDHRRFWEGHGLPVVALQALLFGRPELTVFGDPATRRRTADYLRGMIDLAADLGAGALVFGSPRNRLRGELPEAEAWAIACEFFAALGDHAAGRGVWFCVEANPPGYGCDFVTTAGEAAALVRRVGRPGFGLHLDAGGMALIREHPPADVIPRHAHVSAPHLAAVSPGTLPRADWLGELRASGYAGAASVEMRCPGDGWPAALAAALAHARELLGVA